LKNLQFVLLQSVKSEMKIQVLAEGFTPEQRVRGEWGLSLLINDNILFDTFGHPEIIEKNIKNYNAEIRGVKNVIISHNHWDHVSGLRTVLQNMKSPTVCLPQIDEKLLKISRQYDASTIVSDEKGTHEDGYILTGAIKAKLKNDSFMEQGLILEGKKGPVLIVGCSHPGIIKMVKHSKKLIKKSIYGVIGGLHLKDSSNKKILKIAQSLKNIGVKSVYAGHCTGAAACKILKSKFGAHFKKIKQGNTYIF
jgi:7,8-dihydropterin-6-yl-methyl-4-(beta-D-ribofuranosyl)aminobenzene 5'-phosphate synthase